MRDHEGSTYVPADNSLWLVDDNANAVYEVNATTGALKRTINRSAFNSAPKFGGGPQAGTNRTDDFESMAFDQTNNHLYVFSGPCCVSSNLPTAFRLTRQSGTFQVESHQPLASGANYTASSWNFADGKIYVGVGSQLRTYDYESNMAGSTFQVPGLSAILGMGFSSDGADLFVVTNAESLKRVNWASRTIVPGWTFDLTPFGVMDSRGVELIGGQIFVSDGADSRPAGPLKYAVFVFDVSGPAPIAPVAAIAANPTSGEAPLTVNFTDASTGGTPTSWTWDFGDGSPTSSAENPSHVYNTPNTYTVTLTVSNSAGGSSDTEQIAVTPTTQPIAAIVANPTSGAAPLTVNFTDASTGGTPTSWTWDFGDGSPTSSAENPSHVYNTPNTYTVTLTVSNSAGGSSDTEQIAVTAAQNFVGNPGFETNTAGWGVTGSGAGVALTRVTTPVHTGTGAALLRNNAAANRKCVLNDVPNWVTTTQAGLHTGSIWVRGGTAGKTIKITLREINGGSVVGSRVVTYTLTGSWQQLTVTYTPVRAGTSTLDLQAFMPAAQAPPGICFYADDASIIRS